MSNQQNTQIGINKINTQIENPVEPITPQENRFQERIPDNRKTEHNSVKTQHNANLDNRFVSNSIGIDQDILLTGKPFKSFVATPLPEEPLENGNINRRTGFAYNKGNFSILPNIRDQPLLDDANEKGRVKKFQVAKQTETTKPVSNFREFRNQRRK